MQRIALTLILLAISVQPAAAALIQLDAVVDGAQAAAGAGTGSSATGFIDLTLDDETNLLTWSGAFSGLGSPFLVAHFHGPAAPDQGAGVQIGTAVTTSNGGLDGTAVGSATLSASQVSDLLGGLWYWNVHSDNFPGGEIRGNISIVPEPGIALLMGIGLAGLALRSPRR